MSLGDSSGSAGITVMVAACVVVCWLITLVTGTYSQWLFVLGGIIVDLWAVASINK